MVLQTWKIIKWRILVWCTSFNFTYSKGEAAVSVQQKKKKKKKKRERSCKRQSSDTSEESSSKIYPSIALVDHFDFHL